ncbi:uncharacterized protein [Amphiura filiformis]|uniref:uncharacterized protein n=1 Tax=Amphiura filiformis TaxID=82378 RepID=UPI003B2253FA
MHTRFTQAVCPQGLSAFKYESSVCQDHLDCSYKAINKYPLEDTLLKNTEVQSCVKDQNHGNYSSFDTSCPDPVLGYQSGFTHVDFPINGGSCSFCFKLNIVRFDLYPIDSTCEGGKRKRATKQPTNFRKDTIYVMKGREVTVPIEKIGPDTVTVDFRQINSNSQFRVRAETLTLSKNARQQELKLGPIEDNYTLQLLNPTEGIIGIPGTIYIKYISLIPPTSSPK